MMLAIIISLLSPVLGAPVETTRPVPDVVARHDRKRPGVIVGAVVGSVVGAFIIVFAVLWWRGKGCLDRRRPVTPSPPDSGRASCASDPRGPARVLGRIPHEEGWHNLPNPTRPAPAHSSPGSFRSDHSARSDRTGRSARSAHGNSRGSALGTREKDKLGSTVSVHSTASSPRKAEHHLPYIKASSPPPASPPPLDAGACWKIPRPHSAASFRSATSSPVKEPYIRASSETSRETRERRVSQQERYEHRDRTLSGLSGHKEDLVAVAGARMAAAHRSPSLNHKPSFTMMLKNTSKASLGAGAGSGAGGGGYVTTQERLRDQDEEEEMRDWTTGMKPLDVDRL